MRVRFLTYRVTAMLGAASLTMLFVRLPGFARKTNPRRVGVSRTACTP